ncbi:GNAT family N-acetyltransferase [Amphibacillus sp. Q70]|uniref:GNAT family N-acetyltransferase n=1 Tax=Amphibacillus sp. Q70 TaxID=3453416 RepID=UPI003F837660
MKQSIRYRSFQKKDIKSLVSVIIDTWDYEKMFSKKVAYHFAHIFLYSELIRQSFTQVAEIDGQTIGIIIGDLKNERKSKNNLLYWPKFLWHVSQLLLLKQGRSVLINYGYRSLASNRDMLNRLNESFETELALFVVSPKVQGLGVGSRLYHYFLEILQQKKIAKFFLYTDTTCNFGFYQHKGLKRLLAVKKQMSSPINKEIEYYIYKGKVT